MRIIAWMCGFFVLIDGSWYRFRKLVARTYYRTQFEASGKNCRFDPLSSEIRYGSVKLGHNVFIGPGAVIGRAEIGNDVMFGPGVHVRSGNHSFEVMGKTIQEADDPRDNHGPVVVGDDVWVGQDTTILHGGAVGEGSVIGTRSLVSRPIPPYVVAAGQPCRVIRKRFSDDDLRRHLALRHRNAAEIEQIISARNQALDSLGDRTDDP